MANTVQTSNDSDRERRLELFVQRTAAFGMALCAALLVLGLIRVVATEPPPAERHRPDATQLLDGVVRLDGVDLIDLGLLALIATPVARVAALGVGWLRMGDVRFAAVAAIVLCLLLAGVWLGAR